MKIALFFDQLVSSGGGFYQSLNSALLALRTMNQDCEVIGLTTRKENVARLEILGLETHFVSSRYLNLEAFLVGLFETLGLWRMLDWTSTKTTLSRVCKRRGVDLVYFLSPSYHAFCVRRVGLVFTVWDINHRDDPSFPEVSYGGQFESRERLYNSVLKRSTAVVVDSEVSKTRVSDIYGVDKRRICVLPFQSGINICGDRESGQRKGEQTLQKFGIDKDYLFYPAQFWPHKNHTYILDAMRLMRERNELNFKVVFSGSDKGNLDFVISTASDLGLSNEVVFAGFVTDSELLDLYQQAFAIVMPTYFGPTNLPPLEAWKVGTPVIYSGLDDFREQMGNAALFVDLKKPETLCTQIKILFDDSTRRNELVASGFVRVRETELRSVRGAGELKEMIRDFFWARSTWKRKGDDTI